MTEYELERQKLNSLQEYDQDAPNQYIQSAKTFPPIAAGIGAADSLANTLYNGAVGIDRQVAGLMGNTPLLEPKDFRSSEGIPYELGSGASSMAQYLGTRGISALGQGAAVGAANAPYNPERGAIEGAGYAALGESVGPLTGKVIKGAGNQISKLKDTIGLDSATQKYVDMISQAYNVSKDEAWGLMEKLVGKTEKGGLGSTPLIKEVKSPGLGLEEAAEQYTKSKQFQKDYGKDAQEEMKEMIADMLSNPNPIKGKTPEKQFQNYLNSKDFKKKHGSETPSVKEEYSEMFDSMVEYLGGKMNPPKNVAAPGIDNFLKMAEEKKAIVPPKAKEWIRDFKKEPTIENAYHITRELNKAKSRLGPSDIELSNQYDEMIKNLQKGFKTAGEEISPGVKKSFELGNQKYAENVAPFYSSPIIESAAGGNALPTVELRPLTQSIAQGMESPARGVYPEISDTHMLAAIRSQAEKDIAKSDLLQNQFKIKALLGLVGGVGTPLSRAKEKEVARKWYGRAEKVAAKPTELFLKQLGKGNPEEATEIQTYGE